MKAIFLHFLWATPSIGNEYPPVHVGEQFSPLCFLQSRTSTEVQDKIFRNMSKRAATMLKEDMEFMGPVRETDVKAAQANIVKAVFRFEEMGDIVIARFTVGKLID